MRINEYDIADSYRLKANAKEFYSSAMVVIFDNEISRIKTVEELSNYIPTMAKFRRPEYAEKVAWTFNNRYSRLIEQSRFTKGKPTISDLQEINSLYEQFQKIDEKLKELGLYSTAHAANAHVDNPVNTLALHTIRKLYIDIFDSVIEKKDDPEHIQEKFEALPYYMRRLILKDVQYKKEYIWRDKIKQSQTVDELSDIFHSIPNFVMRDLKQYYVERLQQLFEAESKASTLIELRQVISGYTDEEKLILEDQIAHFRRDVLTNIAQTISDENLHEWLKSLTHAEFFQIKLELEPRLKSLAAIRYGNATTFDELRRIYNESSKIDFLYTRDEMRQKALQLYLEELETVTTIHQLLALEQKKLNLLGVRLDDRDFYWREFPRDSEEYEKVWKIREELFMKFVANTHSTFGSLLRVIEQMPTAIQVFFEKRKVQAVTDAGETIEYEDNVLYWAKQVLCLRLSQEARNQKDYVAFYRAFLKTGIGFGFGFRQEPQNTIIFQIFHKLLEFEHILGVSFESLLNTEDHRED